MFVIRPDMVSAQGCDPSTPSFIVNLSGRPDSTWTSTAVQRAGNCCGTTPPDACIEFILTLDSGSNGIRLDIPTGALPGGALFYQIACGTSYQVGQDICLNGPGPHRITFCKPGNNINTYKITAIPKPDLKGKLVINEACAGHLKANGLVLSTITWQSVPNNATYNSYLSCLTGCDSVSIIPTGNFPPTVTYRVCGNIAGGCGGATFCDTATVRFVTNTDVDIQPKNPTVCFGGSTTSITANPVGGLPPYSFLWNTNETTATIQVSAGTYFVQMLDSLKCTISRDTVVVTAFSSAIDANAGSDTSICRNTAQASLHGILQGGVGGIWKGGAGTYAPNDTTVNATYKPSAAEITAGSVMLRLVTTRNGTCPADSDDVLITINPNPVVTLTGPANVCSNRTSAYSTKANTGNTYQWNVTGGTITSTIADTLINVLWGAAGAGMVSIKQTNASGCDSTRTMSITINPNPLVTLTGPVNVCTGRSTSYTTRSNAGNIYQWNVTGGTITSTIADTLINVLWGVTGAGTVSIKQTNLLGCDSTQILNITINPIPVVTIAGPVNVCTGRSATYTTKASAGNTYQWNVTGGTITSTVADTLINVLWGAVGTGNVSIRQTSAVGCDSTKTMSIAISPIPVVTLTGPVNVCTGRSATYTTKANTGNTYQWNVTGGTITSTVADTLINVLWGAVGAGNVSIKQISAIGCDSIRTLSITVNPIPAVTISGPVNVCTGRTTSYTTRSNAGNTYQWNVSGGTITSTVADTLINVLWGAVGTGNVSIKQTSAVGCDSMRTLSITVNPIPAVTLNATTNACAGKTASYYTNANTGNLYLWNITGGTITSTVADTLIHVLWGPAGAGSVSIKQTSASGCDSIRVLNFMINPTPTVTISGPVNVCSGKTTSYSTNANPGNTYQWSVSGGTITSTVADTLIRVLWGASGTGSVSIKQTSALGCDSTRILNITINPTPAVTLNGPGNGCSGKTTSYSTKANPGNTYQWNVTGGAITSTVADTLIHVLWGAAGTGNVSIKQTSTSGCDSTRTLSITINPTPAVTLSGPVSVCAYKTNSYSTNANAGNTYQWDVTGGTITSTVADTLIYVKWGAAGSGSVSIRQTNTLGCDSLRILNTTINPSPVVAITGSTGTCAGTTYTYRTAKQTGVTYNWSIDKGTIVQNNDSVVFVRWDSTGSGTITVQGVNTFSCDSSFTLPVTITATPIALVAGSNDVCAYSQSAYFANGSNISSYKWTISNGTILGVDTNALVTVKWGAPAAGSLKVRVISPAGCDSSTTLNVVIRPTPLPVITGPDSVCMFTQSQYRTAYAPGNTYAWQAVGGTLVSINDTTVLVNWHNGLNASVSVKVTNPLLCDSTAVLPVKLLIKPRPVITGPPVLCEKQTGTYITGKASQVVTTTWSVPSGVVQAVSDTQIRITWANAGLHRIYVQQVNSKGCDTTVYIDVLVNAKPFENIQGANSVCRYAEKSWRVNHTAGYTYQWKAIGGTITGSHTDSVVYVRWDTTTGVLQLRLINANGCDTNVQKIINVKAAPSGHIYGDTISCTNVVKYSYSVDEQPGVNYLWNADIGDIIGSNVNHDVDVSWKKFGLQKIRLYVINTITGCDSSFHKDVRVDTIIKPELSLNKSGGCIPFTLTFEPANITIADYNYSWSFGNGATSNKRKENVNYTTPGVFETKLLVVNKSGCRDSATTNIVAKPKPVAKPDYERVSGRIYVIEDTVQFINRSIGGNRFIWKIITVKTDTAFETRSSFEHPGNYRVWLTAIDTLTGCLDSAETDVKIWVRENVYVPTAFTPNGDGNNDFFSIGFENVVDFEVLIVNRWGEIIYRSSDPDFKWDGTFKNEQCQTDAYVYLVHARGYHGKPFSMKGTVTLLR